MQRDAVAKGKAWESSDILLSEAISCAGAAVKRCYYFALI